jgi:hypothetical protein
MRFLLLRFLLLRLLRLRLLLLLPLAHAYIYGWVSAQEVGRCEALFYKHVANLDAFPIAVPTCFFADYSALTGEFVLITEVIPFGTGRTLPLKHRVRDAAVLEEQKLFVRAGAALNTLLWHGSPDLMQLEAVLPRFELTHRPFWFMVQVRVLEIDYRFHSFAYPRSEEPRVSPFPTR